MNEMHINIFCLYSFEDIQDNVLKLEKIRFDSFDFLYIYVKNTFLLNT